MSSESELMEQWRRLKGGSGKADGRTAATGDPVVSRPGPSATDEQHVRRMLRLPANDKKSTRGSK